MSTILSSSTAAIASVILLIANAAYAQPRDSQPARQQTQNFYITTPQTGEQTPIGQVQAVSTSASSQPAATQTTLNTYAGTATWQYANSATRSSSKKESDSSRSSTRAPRQQTQTASQQQYQQYQQAYNNYYANQNSGQAQQANYNTYYQASANQQTAQQTSYPSYVAHASASTRDKQGMLSRLLHRKPKAQVIQVSNPAPSIKQSKYSGTVQAGTASWYGSDFHGGKTANGERYNMESMTAAHRTLPFGTLVKVRNERNGQECVVRINNRGPFIKGRILDVSKAAARQLGMVNSGIAKIKMEVLGRS